MGCYVGSDEDVSRLDVPLRCPTADSVLYQSCDTRKDTESPTQDTETRLKPYYRCQVDGLRPCCVYVPLCALLMSAANAP